MKFLEFIKFYEEKEITDLLDYAIFEKYIAIILEDNPLLQVLKEKNTKYFDYANNRIKVINTKLDRIRIGPNDIEALVQGTPPQHRVTKISPRPAKAEDLRKMFAESMTLW